MPLRFRWVWAPIESANKKSSHFSRPVFWCFPRCDAGGRLPWRKRIAWLGRVCAPWLAFLLLIGVGTKMIRESFYTDAAQEIAFITHRVMLTLAVATHVDAMAAWVFAGFASR